MQSKLPVVLFRLSTNSSDILQPFLPSFSPDRVLPMHCYLVRRHRIWLRMELWMELATVIWYFVVVFSSYHYSSVFRNIHSIFCLQITLFRTAGIWNHNSIKTGSKIKEVEFLCESLNHNYMYTFRSHGIKICKKHEQTIEMYVYYWNELYLIVPVILSAKLLILSIMSDSIFIYTIKIGQSFTVTNTSKILCLLDVFLDNVWLNSSVRENFNRTKDQSENGSKIIWAYYVAKTVQITQRVHGVMLHMIPSRTAILYIWNGSCLGSSRRSWPYTQYVHPTLAI